MRGSNCNLNLESNPENEVELLLLKQQQQKNHNLFLNEEMDFNDINRSGSAPPTVDGAFLAAANLFVDPKFEQFNDNSSINGFLTEEEIRSNPAYVEYYYSNMNLNPRLPPPLFSKEDWRVAQRVRAAGGVGDLMNKKLNDNNCGNSLMFSNLSVKETEEDELLTLRKFTWASSSEMESRRKNNYANALQDGFGTINYTPFGARDAVADTADSLSGLSISKGHKQNNQQQNYYEESRAEKLVNNINYAYSLKDDGSCRGLNMSNSVMNEQINFPTSVENMRILSQSNDFFPNVDVSSHLHGGFTYDQNLDMMSNNDLTAELLLNGAIGDEWTQGNMNMGPDQFQYHHGWNIENSLQGHEHLQPLERAYMEPLLVQQKEQYSLQMFQNEKYSQFPSTLRGIKGEPNGFKNNNKGRFESLLDTAKNKKTKPLQLSDILGNVVEFSMDQYGSRFIQQKLETATLEEKIKIFAEIIPHARNLMTNVFGNYVIQKIFEHGTENQWKELASQVIGHVLPLSLHMYGCRVIQKALEVIDVELQSEMVAELNDSVMKCILDQNGNHVIQKCIECVPQDQIQFILSSLLGQVVILSSHPYGCRVVQRALQHCVDPKTQQIIMDELMSSVCKLAQDQYGNYVLQHVLQHGKPQERSAIINKLAGQIVKMSQQKFASNVIEKCLIFGSPEERKLLVNEMLGSTDENEPLQAMMKDPFGNYVVQKVLETCDDQSRDLILSRIKVHLNALKRYTYGKHIVSRVEKLVATGERQIGISI